MANINPFNLKGINSIYLTGYHFKLKILLIDSKSYGFLFDLNRNLFDFFLSAETQPSRRKF